MAKNNFVVEVTFENVNKRSNDNFKEITEALSTLISQSITHCSPVIQQLQKLIKKFYFYIICTKSSKLVDFQEM